MKKEDWLQVSPATTRRERRKQEYQERILLAAIDLFERQGCEITTLEEICLAADVSRPTFYKYYASKQELIGALGEKLWLSVAQEMTSKSQAEHHSTCEYIASFIELIKDELNKYNNLERELIRQSMMSGPNDERSVNMLKALTALIETVYIQGQEKGDIGDRYDTDFLAEITMGHFSSIMMNWAMDDNYPVAKRLEQLADLVPHMLMLKKS